MVAILTAILATYGVSKIISQYDGPFAVFSSLRNRYPLSPLMCTVCISVYIGAIISIFSGLSIIEYLAVLGVIVLVENKL